MPKVLFVTWSESQPSTRYRIHKYLPGLERDGFETELFPASGLTLGRRAALLIRAASADVVYVQKKLFNPVFLPVLAAANGKIVFDYDDASFAPEPYNQRPRGMAPGSKSTVGRLTAALRRARAVVAGNSFLASYAKRHNRNVHVLPTPVDTEASRPALFRQCETKPSPARGEGPLRIGWLGTSKNLYYLRKALPALEKVRSRLHGVELSVLSNALLETDVIAVRNVPWSEKIEPEWLASLDAGIMPLEEDDWSRGKCAFKLLQYMAAGLPTVSSPVGMNLEVVEDGVNGMHAGTTEEWAAKLCALLEDPRLRAEMGSRARRTVEDKYSLRVCLKKLEHILTSVVDEGPRS